MRSDATMDMLFSLLFIEIPNPFLDSRSSSCLFQSLPPKIQRPAARLLLAPLDLSGGEALVERLPLRFRSSRR